MRTVLRISLVATAAVLSACGGTSTSAPSGLAYRHDSALYVLGAPVSPNLPTVTGSDLSWSVAPALPAGLSLDASTGAITGTPTAIHAAAPYTVTAANVGGSASVVLQITVATSPGAPSDLAVEGHVRAATLTWSAPASTGGSPITGYAVSISPAVPTSTIAIVGTTASVFGLANGAAYVFTVTATTAVGSSPASAPTPPVTTPDLPGAPTGVAAVAGDAAVDVAWTEPSSLGGRALTGYTVIPSPAAPTAVYDVVGTHARVTGLANGTSTTFRVFATSTVGNGPASIPSNAVTPLSPPSGLAYGSNPAVYTRGSAISANVPTSGGGAAAAYSVTPSLPAGLALDGSTGVISGTPTMVLAAAGYTVTGTNVGGSTSAVVRITVNDVAPSGLTYSLPFVAFSLQTPGLATIPSTSGGGRVVSWTVAPPLPQGLAIDPGTGVISGTATSLASAADHVVTATNSGGSTAATVNVSVLDKPPCDFVYGHPVEGYEKDVPIRVNDVTFVTDSTCSTTVSFSLAQGTLPTGLALASDTGRISGTPGAVHPATMYAVLATNSGGQRQRGIYLGVYLPPASRYVVKAGLETQTHDFYRSDLNWPVNQSKFGFCETASSSGMISYARYGNTNQVSPQHTLYRAFDSSGWFPLPPPPVQGGTVRSPNFYLWYTPALGNLWDFFQFRGYALFPGSPRDATVAYKNAFDNMYCDLEGLVPCVVPSTAPEPVPAQLPYVSATWNTGYQAYVSAVETDPSLLVPFDIRSEMLPLHGGTFGELTLPLSTRISNALSQGYLVQIMWKIIEYKGVDALYYQYEHLIPAANLSPVTPIPAGRNNNVFALGRPSTQGGDHWVYLFSYAEAEGEGDPSRKIFLMRNSWGDKNGENGNFYMADNFLEGQYGVLDSAFAQTYDVNGNPKLASVVQTAWALKIRPPPP